MHLPVRRVSKLASDRFGSRPTEIAISARKLAAESALRSSERPCDDHLWVSMVARKVARPGHRRDSGALGKGPCLGFSWERTTEFDPATLTLQRSGETSS